MTAPADTESRVLVEGAIVTDAQGDLVIDGCRSKDLAAEFGTPTWVVSEEAVRHNYRRLTTAFRNRYPNVKVAYATKANPEPGVIAIAASEGALVDVVSAGHIRMAERAGVEPASMILNGNAKSRALLAWAVEAGVGAINVDSAEEMRLIAELAPEDGAEQVRVSMRLAADSVRHGGDAAFADDIMESKFGMSDPDALEAAAVADAHPGIALVGLHNHIGWTAYRTPYSVELDLNRHRREVQHVVEFAALLKDRFGTSLTHVNLGGGYRVGRTDGFGPGKITSFPGVDDYALAVAGTFAVEASALGIGEPDLILEAGGYLVANAAVLLARVNSRKESRHGGQTTNWVFLEETGAYHFVRRLIYDFYHQVVLAEDLADREWQKQRIAGPVCTGDTVAREALLPELRAGDLIAILDQGAYCEAVASDFCAVPIPACVIASRGRAAVARQRETLEEYVSQFQLPPWLQQ